MKMKIEFRGKATGSIEELEEIGIKHTNGWVYGNYVEGFIVIGDREQWSDVDPKTVGQYTNLNDKNGKKIFDGDRCWNDYEEDYGIVSFDEGKFIFTFDNVYVDLFEVADDLEVVGNIHDNPELLEVSK